MDGRFLLPRLLSRRGSGDEVTICSSAPSLSAPSSPDPPLDPMTVGEIAKSLARSTPRAQERPRFLALTS